MEIQSSAYCMSCKVDMKRDREELNVYYCKKCGATVAFAVALRLL